MENPVWFKAHPEGMKRKQLERYSNEYRAYLERLFDNLAEYKVLVAVVHGDVEPVNVVLEGDEKCTFIDMFYTQVSFPFLNVVMLPIKYAHDLSNYKELDFYFYLEYWRECESMERLRELALLVSEVKDVDTAVLKILGLEQAEKCERE
ncbi:hypothetical protein BWQ96_02220 [Gracilariopsis chorda]|uniref:Aminoglycoside phosphotransferase domain-containing protein n=1 Tax=Gracilariopsis chorda TaxID=448386 RepID=A0A2V3J0Z8_9FLOR|nr:hypothetical protein BWQ96_02220 [Gracilariopsis chorda]|eukprot:PXF48029.1 hypothetical protein BWQ96_02220 [Gracilariopsis chorda]